MQSSLRLDGDEALIVERSRSEYNGIYAPSTASAGGMRRALTPGPRTAAHITEGEITASPSPHHRSQPHLHQTPASASGSESLLGDNSLVHVYHIAIYGWKRSCFYLLLLFLVLLVLINSVLTIWIMTTINFSSDGMGKLKMRPEGVRLAGNAFFLKDLYANAISAPQDGKSLRIVSSNEIKINALPSHEQSTRRSNTSRDDGEKERDVTNRLFVGPSLVGAIADQFVIRNPDGKLLLMVDETNVVLTTDRLRVNNPVGIKFNCSLQAPLIQSNSYPELKLQSLTRQARVLGPRGVSLTSGASLRVTALRDLTMRSRKHQITLNASRIEFRNLRTALPTRRGRTYPGIHQLCLCPETRILFMSPAEGHCIFDEDICKPRTPGADVGG